MTNVRLLAMPEKGQQPATTTCTSTSTSTKYDHVDVDVDVVVDVHVLVDVIGFLILVAAPQR